MPDDLPDDDIDVPHLHRAPDRYWEQQIHGFAHEVTLNSMHFLEQGLCPDIRYDPEIAKLIATEVFPEIKGFAQNLAERISERIDTLAELHMLAEEGTE